MGSNLHHACSLQTGMTGCAGRDVSLMFDGDNVVSHLSELFDGKPQTHSVSANHKVIAPEQDYLVTLMTQWNLPLFRPPLLLR